MTADCLFCKIIQGEIPANKVFENDQVLAFEDISPQAPTHVLVIPKQHSANLLETSDLHTLGHVLEGIRQVAHQINAHDFRTIINNGAEAGQSVFHLHAHLLSGRPFSWPPG